MQNQEKVIPFPPQETQDASKNPPADISDGNIIELQQPEGEQNYIQVAESELYDDENYVSISNNLYKWTGKHYEVQSETNEKKKLSEQRLQKAHKTHPTLT